jgi:hypothetical protein
MQKIESKLSFTALAFTFKIVISGVMYIILDTIYCMSIAVIRLVSLNVISDIDIFAFHISFF